jgi:hypothetical protein
MSATKFASVKATLRLLAAGSASLQATFNGTCRSLWNWTTLGQPQPSGVGTNTKFYIQNGGAYYDITPIRVTTTLGTNPFTGNGTTTVTVDGHVAWRNNGLVCYFSGTTGTYAATLNAEFQITVVNANSYTITTSSVVAAGATGGSAVSAAYQVNAGPAYAVPLTGWGAGLGALLLLQQSALGVMAELLHRFTALESN